MQTRTSSTTKKTTGKSAAASKLASNSTSSRTKSAAASKLASGKKTTAKKIGTTSKSTTAKKSTTSKTKQPGMQTGTGILTDQERITDLMFCEKKMQENYSAFASECVSPKLRDEFLKIMNKSHMTQYDLFTQAQSRGWYKPKPAQAAAVKQAYTKFSAMNKQ